MHSKISALLLLMLFPMAVVLANKVNSDDIPLSQCWPCERCYDQETCTRCQQYYVDDRIWLTLDPGNCYRHCYAHQKIRPHNLECPFEARCKDFCTVVPEDSIAKMADKQACKEFLEHGIRFFRHKLTVAIQNPKAAAQAVFLSYRSTKKAKQKFPTTRPKCNPCWNGPCDAYRHCLWSCELAKLSGNKATKHITDAYEYTNRNSCSEMLSDLKNNSIGRALASEENCENACSQADLDIIKQEGECR